MPSAAGYFLLAVIGLFAGALVNVLADDLPHRRRPGLPACPHCGQIYLPHHWLAVVAYLPFWGGRCRRCGSPIPLRRVVVEIASALALVYLRLHFGLTWHFAVVAVFVEVLLLVTVIDVEHRLILRVVIYPAATFALVAGVLNPERGPIPTLIGGAVGFGLTYLFYVFGRVFTRAVGRLRGRELNEVAFGWGDVNFGLFIGLAVGWSGVLFALLIAVFAGGLAGAIYLVVMRFRRRGALFLAMPYGPFLALGALVMLVWAREFVAWYFR